MVLKIVVISAVLSYFALMTHARLWNCESKYGDVLSAYIEGCKDEPRCVLKRSKNYTVHIDFKSKVDSPFLISVAHGFFVYKYFRMSFSNENGCDDSGIVCPIKEGAIYNYTTTMPIKSMYPKVSTEILWKLQNGKGTNIICAKIPIQVSD